MPWCAFFVPELENRDPVTNLLVDSAGEVHQELAIRTGGLRFSVCNADVPELYDAVVAAAAGPRACD
jgi:hypothetical protein